MTNAKDIAKTLRALEFSDNEAAIDATWNFAALLGKDFLNSVKLSFGLQMLCNPTPLEMSGCVCNPTGPEPVMNDDIRELKTL